jgi:uncharacterized protein (DUF2384 family)
MTFSTIAALANFARALWQQALWETVQPTTQILRGKLWRELAMQIGMRFITEARSRRVVSLPIFAAMLEFIGSEHRLMPKLSTSKLSLSRLSRYQLHRSRVQANKNIPQKNRRHAGFAPVARSRRDR